MMNNKQYVLVAGNEEFLGVVYFVSQVLGLVLMIVWFGTVQYPIHV